MRRILLALALSLMIFPALAAEPDAGPATPAADVQPSIPTDTVVPPVGPPHEQPEDITEAFETGSFLIEAAKNGYWGIFAGLLIMLLIFVLDKLVDIKKRVGEKAVPWVAASLGVVGAIAAELSTGVFWGQALLHGFTAGATAVGLWEMIFKQLLNKTNASGSAQP